MTVHSDEFMARAAGLMDRLLRQAAAVVAKETGMGQGDALLMLSVRAFDAITEIAPGASIDVMTTRHRQALVQMKPGATATETQRTANDHMAATQRWFAEVQARIAASKRQR